MKTIVSRRHLIYESMKRAYWTLSISFGRSFNRMMFKQLLAVPLNCSGITRSEPQDLLEHYINWNFKDTFSGWCSYYLNMPIIKTSDQNQATECFGISTLYPTKQFSKIRVWNALNARRIWKEQLSNGDTINLQPATTLRFKKQMKSGADYRNDTHNLDISSKPKCTGK